MYCEVTRLPSLRVSSTRCCPSMSLADLTLPAAMSASTVEVSTVLAPADDENSWAPTSRTSTPMVIQNSGPRK